jgi:hypothetical protein
MQFIQMFTNKEKTLKASSSWLLPFFGFILAAGFSAILAFIFPNSIRITPDLWFNADIVRVIWSMVSPEDTLRSNVHPLLGLIILPVARPFYFLARMAGLNDNFSMGIAAQLITSISAGITWLLVYWISINMGLKRAQGFAMGIFFLSSSTFMFWWSTPEAFPLGSPTILTPFFLLSLEIKSYKLWLLSLVASASITITNFSAGLIASCTKFGFRKPLIGMYGVTLAIVILLSLVQKSYIPAAKLPLQNVEKEAVYIKFSSPPTEKLYQFFVVPIAPLSPPKSIGNKEALSQILRFGIPTLENIYPLGVLAVVIWILLLLNGSYAAALKKSQASTALMLFVGFQLFLHFVYGDSPFLYSAHYTPALILIAGYGLTNSKTKTLKMLLPLLFFTLIALNFNHNIGILKESFRIGELQVANMCETTNVEEARSRKFFNTVCF